MVYFMSNLNSLVTKIDAVTHRFNNSLLNQNSVVFPTHLLNTGVGQTDFKVYDNELK